MIKLNEDVIEKALDVPRAVKYLAMEARRLMEPYVPMRTGALCGDADVYMDGDRGVVHYKRKYAAKWFYAAEFAFGKERHPLATAFWDRAMLAACRDELVGNLRKFMKGQK